MRVGEGLKLFGAMKVVFNDKSVSLVVERKFHESVLAATVT